MTIYRFTTETIRPISPATFSSLGIKERADLQRLLRDQIEIISKDTLVIAEEFGHWEDSRRRIDLLGIDRDANLVVIELKCTEDGGHMELQALRYAAMVSTLTFRSAVEVFTDYLQSRNDDRDAEKTLLEFLGWDEPRDEDFAPDVRIVLASAEFSKELTTAVLWLLDRDISIRCVRLRPYGTATEPFLDVQQVIPLPEAEDYQIKVREKKQMERVARKEKSDVSWNGRDFYVSLGEGEGTPHRNWDDCRQYGFIGAFGGPFYIRTLFHLHRGARVFVNIPQMGYVGVGIVTETVKPIREFTIKQAGKTIPILEATDLRAPHFAQNADVLDVCEHYVRVDWLTTVPREEAYWEKGLFASQHSACKLRHQFTIQQLCKHFGIEDEE